MGVLWPLFLWPLYGRYYMGVLWPMASMADGR